MKGDDDKKNLNIYAKIWALNDTLGGRIKGALILIFLCILVTLIIAVFDNLQL